METKWRINDGKITNGPTLTAPFGLALQAGLIPGLSTVDKFGYNPQITPTSDPEDVWEFGGIYPYDTWGTAPIMYLTSSSNADIGKIISVQGLDINGELSEEIVTCQGQAVVTLSTPLWRVFRMENNSDEGNDIDGVIYVGTEAAPVGGIPADANVRAIITGDNNQTLMALYTIPKGYVGFLFKGELGIALEGNASSLSEYAEMKYRSRRVGKCFKTKKLLSLFPGQSYTDVRSFPDVIPALTDIKLNAYIVTQEMGVWATLDIVLVKEEFLSKFWNEAIGQPS